MTTVDELVERAQAAALRAYAPYSGFRVGAAVLTEDGSVFEGANVENAAYPSGICAESVAIAAAVSAGHRKLSTIAVACIDAESPADAYPCGQCRQRMHEFRLAHVVVAAGRGDLRTHELSELLPHGFTLGT